MTESIKLNYVRTSQNLDPRNEKGQPFIKERNFQTSPTTSGQGKSTYFGSLNSLATHTVADPYIDHDRRLVIEEG